MMLIGKNIYSVEIQHSQGGSDNKVKRGGAD